MRRTLEDGNVMLNGLTLRGYRSFETYQITDLARVNLVVGKNNCGKTSILEAIELLVSGDPSALRKSALRRNELKAVLHAWLAWQQRPGRPYGTAITARYIGHDSPAALRFVEWFQRVFDPRR